MLSGIFESRSRRCGSGCKGPSPASLRSWHTLCLLWVLLRASRPCRTFFSRTTCVALLAFPRASIRRESTVASTHRDRSFARLLTPFPFHRDLRPKISTKRNLGAIPGSPRTFFFRSERGLVSQSERERSPFCGLFERTVLSPGSEREGHER